MNQVLPWIRSHVVVIIFVVVMIAAAVAMPIVTSKMNAGIRAEVETRAAALTKLDALEKTTVEVKPGDPTGGTQQTVINEKLLQSYGQAVEQRSEESEAVFAAAIEHNHKDRGVLLEELFPEPPIARAEVLPRQFHDRLTQAYRELLERIGAGTVPAPQEVQQQLNRRQSQFLTQTLFTETTDNLDEQQLAELRKRMTETRISLYVNQARAVKIYAAMEALNPPAWDRTRLPPMNELFQWQWDYWLIEDLLMGLDMANATAASVVEAPVKRLISITMRGAPAMTTQSSGSAGGGPSGGGSAGFGLGDGGFRGRGGPAGGPGGGSPGQPADGAAPKPLNPKIEATLNYGQSLTGRQSNHLYDVRYADMVLVVDPQRVPEILDALARRNFITAVDVELSEADAFEDLRQGYFYGSGAVARLRLTLETIWLRTWTSGFMPPSVKQSLGVPLPQPEAPQTPSAPAAPPNRPPLPPNVPPRR